VIDLRSDTATLPSPEMRAAMAAAPVGDEQRGEDPTVAELEQRAAAFLGQEAAVYLPTATMANQIAVRISTRPGDELLAEEDSHILVFEQGAVAALSGVVTRPLRGRLGRISPEAIGATVRPASNHHSRTRLVCVENSHNASGGRVWPLDELDAVVETCRTHGLAAHLDGARIVNAAVASNVEPSRIGGGFDTVTLCLSKGLGCPLGAIVAGSSTLMQEARRAKHLLGGAMRQAGIVAAAGLFALDHNVGRTVDDHVRARRIAERLERAALPVDAAGVETNFVLIDVGALDLTTAAALERLAQHGVLLSQSARPGVLRAVVHLGIDDAAATAAADAIAAALTSRVAV
jgi:threonine aldolase